MRHQLLRDSDWAGMAHSLEIRVPFVDLDLIRRLAPLIASSMPPGKRDLAATPDLALPAAVRARAKTGFVAPVREWIAEESPRSRPGGASTAAPERGLRGWARLVYGAHTGSDMSVRA